MHPPIILPIILCNYTHIMNIIAIINMNYIHIMNIYSLIYIYIYNRIYPSHYACATKCVMGYKLVDTICMFVRNDVNESLILFSPPSLNFAL